MEEGNLPFKYLGVPIVTSKLVNRDCKHFIDKILDRITFQRSKSLSFTRRLMLIKDILFSIHIYQSSLFILPSNILKDIDAYLKAFLWGEVDMNRHKAKVTCEEVCVQKDEGGLGIMKSKYWNKVTIAKQLWRLIQPNNQSLWVTQIKENRPSQKNFLGMQTAYDCPWIWRKLLKF